jgi:alcohol dehydrogenase class IV
MLASAWCMALHRRSGVNGRLPHGALCAAVLPHGLAANIAALRARAPQHSALERYTEIARLLTKRSDATLNDGVDWGRPLCTELKIPALRTWGIGEADFPGVLEKQQEPAACMPTRFGSPKTSW